MRPFWLLVVVCLMASLQAQKPITSNPPPLTTKPPSGGGGTTPTCPPGVTVSFGELTAIFHGNECTEGMADANLAKSMPNATISGVDDVFHVALPTTTLVRRGANWEHQSAYHDAGINNFFSPRLFHMPIEAVDAQTLRMCEHDSRWNTDACLVYRLVEPHAIDLDFSIVYHDVSLLAPENAVSEFLANYMPLTSDVGLYTYCVASAGAPVQWCRLDATTLGTSWQHEFAVQPPIDPAPAGHYYGIAATYKDNLVVTNYPRYTQPFYCTVNTNTNTIYQMMFDRSVTATDQILFTLFKWQVKTDGIGTPAQDWRYVVTNPVQGQLYGFKARISVRPRLNAGSIEAECAAEDAVFRAGLTP